MYIYCIFSVNKRSRGQFLKKKNLSRLVSLSVEKTMVAKMKLSNSRLKIFPEADPIVFDVLLISHYHPQKAFDKMIKWRIMVCIPFKVTWKREIWKMTWMELRKKLYMHEVKSTQCTSHKHI